MTTPGRWIDSTEAGNDRPQPTAVPGAELAQAAALLKAATNMHDCSDPQILVHVTASEALRLLPADGVVVLGQDRQGLAPVLHLPVAGVETDPSEITKLCLRMGAAGLLEPRQIADLDRYRPRRPNPCDGDDESAPLRWRSLLVVELGGGAGSRRPTRLVWYSREAGAFTTTSDLAVQFARHAALAVGTVSARHHLEQAMDSRAITGQATGILMSRYQLTANRAFEVLRRCSQDRNIKLREVAEAIIDTGELPTWMVAERDSSARGR